MRKALYLLIVAAMVLSNLLLAKKLLSSQKVSTEIRLSPSQFSIDRSNKELSVDILIYGDSLAALWLPDPQIRRVINYGVQGQTTAQLILRAERELSGVTSEATVILAGGNDLKAIAWFPERSEVIIEQAIENIKTLIVMSPGTTKVVATTPPIFDLPLRYRLLDYQAAIDAQKIFNERIRALQSDNIKILDLYQLFASESDLSEFSNDGVHINSLGYRRVESELHRLLQ